MLFLNPLPRMGTKGDPGHQQIAKFQMVQDKLCQIVSNIRHNKRRWSHVEKSRRPLVGDAGESRG